MSTAPRSSTARIFYSLDEAAQAVGFSTDHIRRAVHTTNVDPSLGVHHLPAKRDTKGRIKVLHTALVVWCEQHADL